MLYLDPARLKRSLDDAAVTNCSAIPPMIHRILIYGYLYRLPSYKVATYETNSHSILDNIN